MTAEYTSQAQTAILYFKLIYPVAYLTYPNVNFTCLGEFLIFSFKSVLSGAFAISFDGHSILHVTSPMPLQSSFIS